MIKIILFICMMAFSVSLKAQSGFVLPGDGRWYRVATTGGQHGSFEYIYSNGTAHKPSIASGEIQFINSKSQLIQRHMTMGYQAQTLHQFAVLNFGHSSEIWVKATPGADAGSFNIVNSRNLVLNPGDTNDDNLADNGGELKVYETLKAYAHSLYGDLVLPESTLSIGTNFVFPDYKLNVKGKIRSQEIKVEMNDWPDYVFSKDYALTDLQSLGRYIDKNGHLPEILPAHQAKADGVEIGEMTKLLLKKVEELTLHLIAKDRQINELQALKVRFEELESRMYNFSKKN